jgi:hypothetical protein
MKVKLIHTLYFLLLIFAVNVGVKIYSDKVINKELLSKHKEYCDR